MLITNPKIEGLFSEFADLGQIELSDVFDDEQTIQSEAISKAAIHGGRLLSKEELHYLIAVKVLVADTPSFWGNTQFRENSPDFWYFSGQWGFVYANNRNNKLGVRYVRRPVS